MTVGIAESTRAAIVVLVLLMTAAWARPVRAQTASPGRSPHATRPLDTAAPRQVVLGTLTLVGLGALSAPLVDDSVYHNAGATYRLAGLWVLAPALIGMAVCAIGESRDFEGRCAPTVGDAYIGGLIGALPGALGGMLVAWSDDKDDGVTRPYVGAAIGAVVGWAIGSVVGATVGWNRGKRLRPGTLQAALF